MGIPVLGARYDLIKVGSDQFQKSVGESEGTLRRDGFDTEFLDRVEKKNM